MVPFPDISPEIFSVNILGFHLALRWYAVSYLMGFICAISLMKLFIRKPNLWAYNKSPMTTESADTLLTYLILGVILGGRLGYVVFYNLEYYLVNPADIVKVWDGGMAFHGGFLGVVFAVFMFCRSNGIPIWSGADLIAIASPPGLFFGRLANFINAELWGRPTDVPWGVIFPGTAAQNCEGLYGPCARHPSQLYEAGLEGLLLFFILFTCAFWGALRRPGLITGIFFAVYGMSRFFVEYFRVPDPQFFSVENPYGYAFWVFGHGLTMGQTLSLPMVFLGLLLILNFIPKQYKIDL